MKTIPLSQGLFAIIDDNDYEELSKYKWFALKDHNTYYAARSVKKEDGKWKQIRMHQEIIGNKLNFIIDHIDGNGLNNQSDNLRHVTRRQNTQNKHTLKTSQYPGIYWYQPRHKWRARIWVDGKRKHLGYWENEYEAYLAYCNANKYFLNQEVI